MVQLVLQTSAHFRVLRNLQLFSKDRNINASDQHHVPYTQVQILGHGISHLASPLSKHPPADMSVLPYGTKQELSDSDVNDIGSCASPDSCYPYHQEDPSSYRLRNRTGLHFAISAARFFFGVVSPISRLDHDRDCSPED